MCGVQQAGMGKCMKGKPRGLQHCGRMHHTTSITADLAMLMVAVFPNLFLVTGAEM